MNYVPYWWAIVVVFLLGCGGTPTPEVQAPVTSPTQVIEDVAVPSAEDWHQCPQMTSATWQNTTLYELTYTEGCIPKGWEPFFTSPDVEEQIKQISSSLAAEVEKGSDISPPIANTFRALYMVEPGDAKALIMGQDPAPQPGLATGLSFSLSPGTSTSKVASVQRVFLEVQNEGFCVDLEDGDLSPWADRGTLLLNMALTIPCPEGTNFCTIAAHLELWKVFTGELIEYVETLDQPLAYILWGSKAKAYDKFITNPKHKAFEGGHPSPKAESKYFFCKNYFNCANDWLTEHGTSEVDWDLSSCEQTEKCCESLEPCIWEWDSSSHSSKCETECILHSCN